jgi:hypothetical protein
MQSSACFSHLNIPRHTIEEAAVELGILMAHVEVWDFNHDDQVRDFPVAYTESCCESSCHITDPTEKLLCLEASGCL